MNLHEYQARVLLREGGIPVPEADVAVSPEEVAEIAGRVGGDGGVVVKAQVHTGGRGKAGGVKLAKDAEEARSHAEAILGMTIKGLRVDKVLVAPIADIATESYLAVIIDRESQRPVVMVSRAGGVDIEEVAAATPEKIFRLAIDPRYGILQHEAMSLAFKLFDDIKLVRQAAAIISKLYVVFTQVGASLAEINPLASTPDGTVLALDAKIVVDDNELDRRPAIEALRDLSAEDPAEVEAREAGLSYVKLEGNVGCCVNGAGLAMATMDLVKYYGGEPANFLDIGGSSNPQKVITALKIISADSNVQSVLFNIFGGITRCDDVAKGIVAAIEEFELGRPLVIRLTGTNEREAVQILEKAGLTALLDMDEAVQKAVEMVGEAA
ncbi:MAG: ADP-forming succinate--CoA ligase subunit beta [Gemmatimonadetes bacterium]|nr:ADP-forming succinate--CoA ligase subunit beta [Gemmatimonadota bacterium]